MLCLNSSPVLNSLEVKIRESIPSHAEHIGIVNAGDGRLARGFSTHTGSERVFSLVEPRKHMHRYLGEWDGVGSAAWDAAWYRERVERHGPFDALVFYQLNFCWEGNLIELFDITDLLKPTGRCWVTFINATAFQVQGTLHPPASLVADTLFHPMRLCPQIDYGSFSSALQLGGKPVFRVWGLLDQGAFDFCGKPMEGAQRGECYLTSKDWKTSIKSIGDAFLYGASVVGIEFGPKGGPSAAAQPQFTGTAFNSSLFQSLVVPYPELLRGDADLLVAMREAKSWREGNIPAVSNLVSFFVAQIEQPESVQTALLVGGGWGKDALLLKKIKPEWNWNLVDASAGKLSAGKDLLERAGITAQTFDPQEPLPFADGTFDIVISAGYFSTIYPPLAEHLARESLRVSRQGVYHLENAGGPDRSMIFKAYSLAEVYRGLNANTQQHSLAADAQTTDMYFLKASKKNHGRNGS